jgi:hypothetical protein
LESQWAFSDQKQFTGAVALPSFVRILAMVPTTIGRLASDDSFHILLAKQPGRRRIQYDYAFAADLHGQRGGPPSGQSPRDSLQYPDLGSRSQHSIDDGIDVGGERGAQTRVAVRIRGEAGKVAQLSILTRLDVNGKERRWVRTHLVQRPAIARPSNRASIAGKNAL